MKKKIFGKTRYLLYVLLAVAGAAYIKGFWGGLLLGMGILFGFFMLGEFQQKRLKEFLNKRMRDQLEEIEIQKEKIKNEIADTPEAGKPE